jgi:hypothetical protein
MGHIIIVDGWINIKFQTEKDIEDFLFSKNIKSFTISVDPMRGYIFVKVNKLFLNIKKIRSEIDGLRVLVENNV